MEALSSATEARYLLQFDMRCDDAERDIHKMEETQNQRCDWMEYRKLAMECHLPKETKGGSKLARGWSPSGPR